MYHLPHIFAFLSWFTFKQCHCNNCNNKGSSNCPKGQFEASQLCHCSSEGWTKGHSNPVKCLRQRLGNLDYVKIKYNIFFSFQEIALTTAVASFSFDTCCIPMHTTEYKINKIQRSKVFVEELNSYGTFIRSNLLLINQPIRLINYLS